VHGARPLSTATLRGIAGALRELGAELSGSFRLCFRGRGDVLWLVALTALGVVVRADALNQPMAYDEAYTFLNFVNPGFPELFNYPLPNNHVLHTILVCLSTLCFGSSPVAIRLPAFLAGVATVPLTFWLCRMLLAGRSGYLATTVVSIGAAYLILYSAMARGYSLLTSLTLVLAIVGLCVVKRPTWTGCAVLSLIGALGMLTIPTMLFALAGLYLWLGALLWIERGSLHRVLTGLLAPCALMTALLSIALYTPSIAQSGGARSIIANSFVRPLPWAEFSSQLVPHVQSAAVQFAWNLPKAARALCAPLVLIGMLAAARQRNWAAALLAPSMLAGGAAVLLSKQSIPFHRTWLYLIPFTAIAADIGLSYAMRAVPSRVQWLLPAFLLVLGLRGAARMIADDTIASGADFPEAAQIVRDLKAVMRPGDLVHVALPIDWSTYFYMWYYGLPAPFGSGDPPHDEFFIVEKRSYAIGALTDRPVTVIAERGGGLLYRLDPTACDASTEDAASPDGAAR